MRYSSSKSYVASGGSIWGPSGGGGGSSGGSGYSGQAMHYRKDGGLDMRYKSSKDHAYSTKPSEPPHYKKDGTLDMRFNSSKAEAVKKGTLVSSPPAKSSNSNTEGMQGGSSGAKMSGSPRVPLKKNGTPDMRFKASKAVAMQAKDGALHLKKDGTPDMRFKSSKAAARISSKNGQDMRLRENRVKLVGRDGLHYRIDGSLDMRYKSSRDFVSQHKLCYVFVPGGWSGELDEKREKEAEEEEAVELFLFEIVSLEMLSLIMEDVPDEFVDEELVYQAYNDKSNRLVLTKEEADERNAQESRIITAIKAVDLNQKMLSEKDANLAKEILGAIISGAYPEIVKRQAHKSFRSVYYKNGRSIAIVLDTEMQRHTAGQ